MLAQLFVEERGTRVAVAVLNSSAVKETAASAYDAPCVWNTID